MPYNIHDLITENKRKMLRQVYPEAFDLSVKLRAGKS